MLSDIIFFCFTFCSLCAALQKNYLSIALGILVIIAIKSIVDICIAAKKCRGATHGASAD